MRNYTYYKKALQDISKPCAFLDIDLLNQNIKEIAARSNNKTIRIASKSVRSKDVLRDILDASPIFQGIMCFTAEEAIYLIGHGFDDLLVAYPVWDASHLTQIAECRRENHSITVMIDSIEHIDHLEKIAKQENCTFLVCIDIDLSSDFFGIHFGVHRSPIKTVEHAMAIVNRVSDSNYLQIDGVMGYEAQIAGVTDNDPNQLAKNKVIQVMKRKSSKELIQKREKLMDTMKARGISPRFVNGGGTGSLKQTASEASVTEVTVGSGFFNPGLFDYYQSFKGMPAAGFALEITRIPTTSIYTCLGGGYIASGAVGKDKQPNVYLPEGARLIANEGAGEVQTPIYYNGHIPLRHGDPIIMRHSKAGELCERFSYLHLIQNGEVIGKYPTYRGDHQCFL